MTDELQNNKQTIQKIEENSNISNEFNGIPIIENSTKINKKKTHGLRGKKKKMIERLVARLGIVTSACKDVDIDRGTHYMWLKEDPLYKQAYDEMEVLVKDVIEASFLGLVMDKNPQAVIHAAKTKLKDRGYGDKLELQHSGGVSQFNLIEKSVEEIKNERKNQFSNKPEAERNS